MIFCLALSNLVHNFLSFGKLNLNPPEDMYASGGCQEA